MEIHALRLNLCRYDLGGQVFQPFWRDISSRCSKSDGGGGMLKRATRSVFMAFRINFTIGCPGALSNRNGAVFQTRPTNPIRRRTAANASKNQAALRWTANACPHWLSPRNRAPQTHPQSGGRPGVSSRGGAFQTRCGCGDFRAGSRSIRTLAARDGKDDKR